MSKYHVTRHVNVIQSTTIDASDSNEAVEKSRKLAWKDWSVVDRKRRKGYKADKVSYPR